MSVTNTGYELCLLPDLIEALADAAPEVHGQKECEVRRHVRDLADLMHHIGTKESCKAALALTNQAGRPKGTRGCLHLVSAALEATSIAGAWARRVRCHTRGEET